MAWVEWFAIPAMAPPDGSPLGYLGFIHITMMMHGLCFLATTSSVAVYDTWKGRLAGMAQPGSFVMAPVAILVLSA